MAKAILSAPDIQPWVQAMAHFVLQDFKKTESISLKEAAETRDPIPRIGCWVLAAHAAREEGKLELALERFEKSAKLLDQAELNDPHVYLFLWIELHEGLLQIARIKQDAEGCLNAMRKLYVKVSEHDGPLSGTTLGYHNLYANELYYQRHFAEAEKEFIALLKAVNERPEKDAAQVQVLRENLAKAISAQGRKEESESIDLRLVAKQPDADQERDASLDRHALAGFAFYQQQKFQEASEQFRIAYDGYLTRLGPDHPTTVTSKNDLAVALQATGKNEEAAQLLIEIITAKEEKVPEDDLSLLENRNNLGNALAGMKAHARAEKQHRIVAELRSKVLGPMNVKTLDAMNNLAGDLQMLGRHEEAIALAKKVVEGRTKVLGPVDPKTLHSRGLVVMVLSAAGMHKEAVAEARSVVLLNEKEQGQRSLATYESYLKLAMVLYNSGNMQESGKWCNLALKGFHETVGPHNRDSIQCEELRSKLSMQHDDGTGSHQAGDPARAVLVNKLNALGPDHVEVLQARTDLGHVLQNAERFAEAEAEYEIAISGLRKKALLQAEPGIDARMGLAEVLRHTRRLKEAELLTREILEDCVSNLPENHNFHSSLLANFGLLLNELGRHEEALAAQKEALKRRTGVLQEGHPRMIKAHFQISSTLWKLKRAGESRAYLEKAYELSRKAAGEQAPMTRMYKHYLQDTEAFDEMLKDNAAQRAREPQLSAPESVGFSGSSSSLSSGPPSIGDSLNPIKAPESPGMMSSGAFFEEMRKRWEKP